MVRITKVDRKTGKMALSMKAGASGVTPIDAVQDDMNLRAFESIPSDQWLTGRVKSLAGYGAFVIVTAPGKERIQAVGLVHITQIKNEFVESVQAEFKVGQEVQVRILSVDMEEGMMSLTTKSTEENNIRAFEHIPSDQWLTGRVKNRARYGAFVTVTAPGKERIQAVGLVHITQIKDEVVESVHAEFKVGQEVQVRVLSVDLDEGVMSLTTKSTD